MMSERSANPTNPPATPPITGPAGKPEELLPAVVALSAAAASDTEGVGTITVVGDKSGVVKLGADGVVNVWLGAMVLVCVDVARVLVVDVVVLVEEGGVSVLEAEQFQAKVCQLPSRKRKREQLTRWMRLSAVTRVVTARAAIASSTVTTTAAAVAAAAGATGSTSATTTAAWGRGMIRIVRSAATVMRRIVARVKFTIVTATGATAAAAASAAASTAGAATTTAVGRWLGRLGKEEPFGQVRIVRVDDRIGNVSR